MADLVTLAVLVAALAGAGVAIGMLIAPTMTRWSERDADDEEPRAGPE